MIRVLKTTKNRTKYKRRPENMYKIIKDKTRNQKHTVKNAKLWKKGKAERKSSRISKIKK